MYVTIPVPYHQHRRKGFTILFLHYGLLLCSEKNDSRSNFYYYCVGDQFWHDFNDIAYKVVSVFYACLVVTYT